MNPFRSNFHARAWLAAAAAALALIACGGDGGDDAVAVPFDSTTTPGTAAPGDQPQSGTALLNAFAATLSGAQEVPPNPSAASGSGTATVNPTTREMLATVTTTSIPGNAAHIHEAAPGISGPIIFPLTETAPGSGIWTGRATLTEVQFNTLKAGGYYFNVHSAAFPNGEIRGQITTQDVTGTSTASQTSFLSALTGAAEVPPTGSTGRGAGTLLATTATREVTAAVISTGTPGIAAHVHQAAPGVNGPIIVPLTETAPGSGIWTGKGILTPDQFTALQSGNMYFNVHSAAFPNGEIRGQIFGLRSSGSSTGVPTGTGSSGTGGAGSGAAGAGTDGSGMISPGIPFGPAPDDFSSTFDN